MTCLWIWLLGVWCGRAASCACGPLFAGHSLFIHQCHDKLILADGEAAWPGVGFSRFFCLDLGDCCVVAVSL